MADKDDFNDFFDGPDIEEAPKEPTPEELEEQREREDTIIVKSHRRRKFMIWSITIVVLAIFLWGFFRYGTPYVSDAQETGYVVKVEKRGFIFKTYEGEMVSEASINDTTKIYQRDFKFSIVNDSIAGEVMKLSGTAKKVTLKYQEYGGVLPWRGSNKCIITGVE
ncbi:MAG: hypothetical protein PHR45_08050 [Muribaculaceae bacterium]|nr:hypothetical protein [Muribaculaceae bacterium]